MSFPVVRPRRLRQKDSLRKMARETKLSTDDLIYPLFVISENNVKTPMKHIPGSYFLSGKPLVEEAKEVANRGIPAVLLFGVPEEREKDNKATVAYSPNGPAQKAVKQIKNQVPELTVITDLCLCEYMKHGHCGVIKGDEIHNDLTIDLLAKAALSMAQAGADVIAPSAMMDGMVLAIRSALDDSGYHNTLTMPYSAKFASNLYGPFKKGTKSEPSNGKHVTHQLDYANGDEAVREVDLDIEEGADMIIVKPALTSLDIIYRIKQEFNIPLAAYNVSGEYSMIVSAGEKNMLNKTMVMLETLTCIKRSGADMIISYFAKDAAQHIQNF